MTEISRQLMGRWILILRLRCGGFSQTVLPSLVLESGPAQEAGRIKDK